MASVEFQLGANRVALYPLLQAGSITRWSASGFSNSLVYLIHAVAGMLDMNCQSTYFSKLRPPLV